ncbi:helix-turn-helix domain-containing protein [Lysobacter sp. H21R4]|uniref:helix-turn-helix transcriptional regulator n=1 Tax=Lysobacter sp. H21R4 TaxID=2781021 RepID=UPI001888BFEB|nr:helix-turn-helix domain-containing protein [Lysobacter sp. H21R4]QOY63569.1 helix-turn-helix domain-containing protein [Lysobacter sp. H21R4]
MNDSTKETQPQGFAPRPVMEDYLTRQELADQMGLTFRTLELWAHRRKGPPVIIIGRRAHYHRDDIAAWLEEQRKPSKATPRTRRVSA